MIYNYILTSYRNLKANKIFALINIAGFAIALVPALLSMLYILYELGFDTHNENYSRIYRVMTECDDYYGGREQCLTTPTELAAAMKAELPEVEYSSRMLVTRGQIKCMNMDFLENNILCADPDFLKIFTFVFTEGSKNSALTQRNSVCLSESMMIAKLLYF